MVTLSVFLLALSHNLSRFFYGLQVVHDIWQAFDYCSGHAHITTIVLLARSKASVTHKLLASYVFVSLCYLHILVGRMLPCSLGCGPSLCLDSTLVGDGMSLCLLEMLSSFIGVQLKKRIRIAERRK